MTNIIVAFSKPEDGKSIRNILMRNGCDVAAVCTSGAQAVSSLEGLNGGIVISGYRFEDMLFRDIHDLMPEGFEMILVASERRVADEQINEDIVYLPMPLKVQDLISTVNYISDEQEIRRKKKRQHPAERSDEDQKIIDTAKDLLMKRNDMTESEAHRYLQKCSMDSGTNLVETAQMVISLMGEE